jgi:hypothetical protein
MGAEAVTWKPQFYYFSNETLFRACRKHPAMDLGVAVLIMTVGIPTAQGARRRKYDVPENPNRNSERRAQPDCGTLSAGASLHAWVRPGMRCS